MNYVFKKYILTFIEKTTRLKKKNVNHHLSKAQYQWLTAKVTHHRNKYNSKGDCEIRESSKRDPDTGRADTAGKTVPTDLSQPCNLFKKKQKCDKTR